MSLCCGAREVSGAAFLLFLFFSCAGNLKRTAGHLCFPSFLAFQWCWLLGVHRRAPLLPFFSCFSVVLTAGRAPPGTSVFLLFLLFSGAGYWGCTPGHLCFPSFLAFQRCWRLGVHHQAPLLSFFSCFSVVLTTGGHRRAPLLSFFSCFSVVLTTGRAPPGTSAFLLFLLFSGADGWGCTAGHLCFPSFLAFQRCWRLGVHRGSPLFFFFSCFSVVLTTGGAPPGTSVFLLFLLFSGADCWACAAGHLCFPSFLAFQRC